MRLCSALFLPRCDSLCAEVFLRGVSAVFCSFNARKEFDSRFVWSICGEFRSERTENALNCDEIVAKVWFTVLRSEFSKNCFIFVNHIGHKVPQAQ